MKIGLLTLFHGNNNWGGNLQGYALKSYIEENFPECTVDLIRYRSRRNVIYKNKVEQMLQYGPVAAFKKIVERVIKKIRKTNPALHNRTKLFKQFQRAQVTNPHIYHDEELQCLAKEYDCLICGSDQVWNPNVALPGFFLQGVNGTRKVSYAASIARDDLSRKEASAMLPLIEKFDHVSVREKTAKRILDERLGEQKEIFEVLDPALMLTKERWETLIGTEKYEGAPYALMFFFSDSSAYRTQMKAYCCKNGLKLVGIPHAAKYIKNDEIGNYEKAYDVGPIEFLRLFRNASYVFTDSFHGSVFSIIFEKQFCVFERDRNTRVSKNSRLYDLLEKFNVSERMVRSKTEFEDVVKKAVSYDSVRSILEKERESSKAFLQNALSSVKEEKSFVPKTVADLQKRDCYGCGLCAQICPKGCIHMSSDDEGFLYPTVDFSACVSCGLCVKKCIGTSFSGKSGACDTYIGYHTDEDIRKESSSGGVFHAIAKGFVERGGVVYGAGFDRDFAVKHMRITEAEDLGQIMRSKYVQSSLDEAWEAVITDLKEGKKVLFSGTPCQVSALYHLTKEKNLLDNLYLVDFICHGTPSPELWKSYLDYVADGSTIQSVNFRDKARNGWHDFALKIEYDGKKQLNESHEVNAYMRSFLTNKNIRPACYDCQYKGNGYDSDITLADAWKIEKEYEPWADDKGTSVFFARTAKGDELLNLANGTLNIRSSNYEFWCKMNPSLVMPTEMPDGRRAMFQEYAQLSSKAFWNKQKRIPVKRRVRYLAKRIVKLLHIEKALRKRS